MVEVSNATYADWKPPQAVDTSIGCGTNNNTTKKAKDLVVGDHILIRNTPCEVKNIARDSTGWLVITGFMLFRKNGRRTLTRRPEADCEVPHVSRADYICTAIYRNEMCTRLCNEYVILESIHDSGPRATRSDVRLPPDPFMRELIRIGLEAHDKVYVTVVSSMGEHQIQCVSVVRSLD